MKPQAFSFSLKTHRMSSPGAREGFTLIELLTVVAILVTLAAIAVPSYLRAQDRSKVSAVKADMRSIATGLESYRVDYNRYPEPEAPVTLPEGHPTYTYIALTTPIVYLSTFMEDPFVNGQYTSTNPDRFIQFSALTFDATGRYFEMNADQSIPELNTRETNSRVWALHSAGPDKERTFSLNAGNLLRFAPIYDPTNGTVSSGEIVRTNLGGDEQIIQLGRR